PRHPVSTVAVTVAAGRPVPWAAVNAPVIVWTPTIDLTSVQAFCVTPRITAAANLTAAAAEEAHVLNRLFALQLFDFLAGFSYLRIQCSTLTGVKRQQLTYLTFLLGLLSA